MDMEVFQLLELASEFRAQLGAALRCKQNKKQELAPSEQEETGLFALPEI